MRTLASKLRGGTKITYYNTVVGDGYTTSGYTPVNVYYNTAYHFNTTYSHTTTVSESGTRQTSHQTSFQWRDFPEPEWTYFDTFYDTAFSTSSSWTTSYLVDTWMPVQTYYVSYQYYEFWTDTSYSQQTWRETTW